MAFYVSLQTFQRFFLQKHAIIHFLRHKSILIGCKSIIFVCTLTRLGNQEHLCHDARLRRICIILAAFGQPKNKNEIATACEVKTKRHRQQEHGDSHTPYIIVYKNTDAMTTELIIRLFVAALLGGIIGLERNYRAKEAGFRTHFLVALGSALFMIVSQNGFGGELEKLGNLRWDASRIASQVVTGIGFIGAGTIIFRKHVVRGLTTAAGLWVTSAIGLTCGSGMYVEAATATILVLLCLETMSLTLQRFGSKSISLTFSSKSKENILKTLKRLQSDGMDVSDYSLKEQNTPDGKVMTVSMEVRMRRKDYEKKTLELMQELDDIDIEAIE